MGVPVRQCVACRKHRPKHTLLRIVRKSGGKVLVDCRQSLPGRGVYLCTDPDCIDKARQMDLAGKSLKCNVPAECYLELAKRLHTEKDSGMQSMLGFAARSGKLAAGATAVENGIRRGKIMVVFLDPATKESTRKRMEQICRLRKIPLQTMPGSLPLDRIIGKPNCKCAGLTDSNLLKMLNQSSDIE